MRTSVKLGIAALMAGIALSACNGYGERPGKYYSHRYDHRYGYDRYDRHDRDGYHHRYDRRDYRDRYDRYRPY